ncbi:MAG: NADPH-dependent 7-cyano-7-deazaguanine reductase QueF [Burkholderiaceae bacterium]
MKIVANGLQNSALGETSAYVDQYDASLLFPITRKPKRDELGMAGTLPFMGADLWTAYELSWLNPRGKPQVAVAHITVPCETPCIVESKSFKLYLNSFNNTVFDSPESVRARIAQDIGAVAWGKAESKVGVKLISVEQFNAQTVRELDGLSLDRLDIDCTHYTPAPQLLTAAFDEQPVTETLTSQLLKSNCLVTSQPDWGSVQISYSGPQIEQGGLLQYIVSFRNHNEFHEQCVERIYTDIMARCKPTKLAVYARYTRRGGIDINPWRTSHPQLAPLNVRSARQ